MASASPTNGNYAPAADTPPESSASLSTGAAAATTAAASSKPKRVRTGCLTCRERHLKCDEGLPICMNCRKSARQCKRGVRLNFIDTTCQQPPTTAPVDDWSVSFLDESRDIASEYRGGLGRYASIAAPPMPQTDRAAVQYDMPPQMPPAPLMAQQALPPVQGMMPPERPSSSSRGQNNMFDPTSRRVSAEIAPLPSTSPSATAWQSQNPQPQPQRPTYDDGYQPDPDDDAHERREILSNSDETLYMQVFVEEVGLWMDSMDPGKHFSRVLPFHSLQQPMLLNAFLACGVRHLTLVNPASFSEEKALSYYDRASRQLLRALQNPQRDSVICATTAVILNVYEIMTEKALPRMNHIAGARALIKECGWDARSVGVGAACFWLNVGLETLSNLRFNWRSSWPPDMWGVDMDLSKEIWPGREEIWTHRMLYIIAKISDFRATITKPQDTNSHSEHIMRQKRYEEWCYLKQMCDTWNENIPRTMHPMAFLYPYQTRSGSAFPEIWLVKRSTIVAQLFYNTAMCLLAQINPTMSKKSAEMHKMETTHAHVICGIAAHVKDRGVASVALRSLAIAAECLTNRREQEEVLEIFTKIHRETGWRIGFIPKDLRDKWGWDPTETSPELPTHSNPRRFSTHSAAGGPPFGTPSSSQYQFDQYGEMQQRIQQQKQAEAAAQAQVQAQARASTQAQAQPPLSAAPRRDPPQGIVNPLFASADFNEPKHPYQEHYVAPVTQNQTQGMGQGLGLTLPLVAQSIYGGIPHGYHNTNNHNPSNNEHQAPWM